MSQKNGRRDLAKANFWRQIITRQKASGKSQKKFCKDEDLNHHSFQSWQQILKRRDAEDRRPQSKKKAAPNEAQEPFVRIIVPEAHEASESNSVDDLVAEIECDGLKIRIFRGIDSESIHAIFNAVQERSS